MSSCHRDEITDAPSHVSATYMLPPPPPPNKIKPDDIFVLFLKEPRMTLTNIQAADRGTYRCRLINSVGEARRDIKLDIRCKYHTLQTTIENTDELIININLLYYIC